MMPAGSKSDLLARCAAEYGALLQLITPIEAHVALLRDADGVSIKDVVAHRAHWIALFLGWYRDGQAGLKVAFPAPGYKWNELARYNADLRAQQAGLSWPEAIAALNARAEELTMLLESLSEAQLYGGPMKGAKNAWTTGRWAEAAGSSHYRSAAKYIRARLRGMG